MAEDTILIVDADAKTRGVLEVSLKKAGYALHVVERARDGLEWLEDGGMPGLIISDTDLPGQSGFEFCAKVKENLDWEPIPFIFLADADSSDEKRQGFELGVEDFLTRPVYVKEVVTRVQLLLQRRKKELLDVADAEQVKGSLEDVTLLDLLQAIDDKDRTGLAEIERGNRRGVIYFRDGRVIDAAVGKLRGAEAVYRMMQWAAGTYAVRYTPTVNRRERIAESTQDLLLTGLKELDQFNDLSSAGPGLERVFEVNYRQLADHLRDIPDEVNGLIRLFDGHRTLQDVVDDSSLGPVETLKVFGKLVDQELLYDVTPKQDEDGLGVLAAPEGSLDDWLGMEAAETVGAAAPVPEPEDESEAEKVRRRREERKRRKTAARKRRTQERKAVAAEEREQWASAAKARKQRAERTDAGADDAEVAALRAQIAEAEARAMALRQQTDALLETKRAQAQIAEHGNTMERKAVSAEQAALMARLEEAQNQAAALALERSQLAAELDEQKAAAEAEAKARRDAEAAAAAAAATAAAEAQAQREAEAREAEARAAAEREAAERARQEEEAAAAAAAAEAARLEAEKKAQLEAAAKAAAEAEIQEKEAAMKARLAEETARLEAARQALAQAKQAAAEEAERLEAARQAKEAAAKQAAEEEELRRKETREREAIRGELAELEAMIKAQEEAAAKARQEAERLSAAAEAQEAVVDWVAATPDKPSEPVVSVDASEVVPDAVAATGDVAPAEKEEESDESAAAKVIVAGAAAAGAAAVAGAAVAASDDDAAVSHVDTRLADLEKARLRAEPEADEVPGDDDATTAIPAPDLPEEDPATRTRSPETDVPSHDGKAMRPTDPEMALAQDEFFNEPDDGYYAEPAPAEEGRNPLYMVLAVVGCLLLFGAVYYMFKGDKPADKKPPVAAKSVKDAKDAKAPAGKDEGTPDKKSDAGAKAPIAANAKADAGAESDAGDADAGLAELPSEEERIATRKKAHEIVWSVAFQEAMFNPQTGEELVRPDGVEAVETPTEADDKGKDKTAPSDKKGVAARAPREKTDRDTSDPGRLPKGKDAAVAELDDAGKRAAFSKHVKAGQRYMKQRNYDKALAELAEANRIAPGSYRVNHLMGVANYYKGRYKQAIPYLERAVRLKSNSADSVAALGDAYQATGRTSKALDAYKKYLKLRPKGRRSDQLREIIARYH